MSVGVMVGDSEGSAVGWRLGDGVGTSVGACVGISVGTSVGVGEGTSDGSCVGRSVGRAVGTTVGGIVAGNSNWEWLVPANPPLWTMIGTVTPDAGAIKQRRDVLEMKRAGAHGVCPTAAASPVPEVPKLRPATVTKV